MLTASAGAMPLADQKKVMGNTLSLLAKADDVLKQKNFTAKTIAVLSNNLKQAVSMLSTFTGKSGKMPNEINEVVGMLKSAVNLLNDAVANPRKYPAGLASTLISKVVQRSQEKLNQEEPWLPLD